MSTILGYVYSHDEPRGLYYVDWCEGPHESRIAFLTVSLGSYADEGSSGADRMSFGIQARCEGLGLADAPYRDRSDFLGRFVAREEALGLPEVAEVWEVCDRLPDDPRFPPVVDWLCGGRPSALPVDR